MAKIIVAALPAMGHLTPLLRVAEELSLRGHQIMVVTGSIFRERVEKTGLAFTPVTGLADFGARIHAYRPERAKLPPGPAMLNDEWIHGFVNPIPDLYAVLQRLLEQDPDQCLICDALWLGALPAALGAPGLRPRRWVAVSTVPLILSSDDTTYFGPVPVGPGEDQKAANRAVNAQFAAMMQPAQDRLAEILRSLGATGACPTFLDGVFTIPDATAVLTVPGLEFERGDVPDSVHLVGFLPGRAVDWEPPAWWAELDGSRPVVAVTQGTIANQNLSQIVEPALADLAGLDVTVVVALGGRETSAVSIPVPPNARVASYIPFDRLLPKADVFITNGGFGGVQQALAAGVPVIASGLVGDLPAVAARVAYHGLGINLQTTTPPPEALADATRSVLEDTQMRANVQKIAEVYAAQDPVGAIERLVLG